MNSSIPPSNRGLPILKLLFLIVLFAVVVGLFFPAVGPTRGAHPRAQAKNDVQNIVAAVKAYYAEYGKYPDVTGDNGDPTQGDVDTIVGDPSVNALTANSALFNILRAIDREPNKGHVLNPQRIVFFQGKPVSDPVERTPSCWAVSSIHGGGSTT